MAGRGAAAATVAALVLAGCGGESRPRDDDQAKLPVESAAVADGGTTACERPLPSAHSAAVPPSGTPFLAGSVWYARDTTVGSDVRRAYAPAAGPRAAMDELLTLLRRGDVRVEGENATDGRATLTYSDDGRGVSVVVTPFCEGYVDLAYHFPAPSATASP